MSTADRTSCFGRTPVTLPAKLLLLVAVGDGHVELDDGVCAASLEPSSEAE